MLTATPQCPEPIDVVVSALKDTINSAAAGIAALRFLSSCRALLRTFEITACGDILNIGRLIVLDQRTREFRPLRVRRLSRFGDPLA